MRIWSVPNLKMALAIAAISSSVCQSLRAQSIWAGPTSGTAMWMNPAHWNPDTMIPSGIDAEARFQSNLTAALTVTFGSELTLGRLSLGDTTTGFVRTTLGEAGSKLIFDVSSGNALLELGTPSNNVRDFLLSDVVLNDTLEVRAGATSGSGLEIFGSISGSGGLIRSVLAGETPSGSSSLLKLHSRNSSYSGDTIIEHGSVEIFGSVLANQNSALGNASSAILIGNANTPTSITRYSTAASLNVRASDDTENLEISRTLDLSKSAESASSTDYRINLNFNANGSGGLNTNRLVLSGDVILGARTTAITAERQGMEIYITGDISTWVPSSGGSTTPQIIMYNTIGAGNNADGVAAGTIRFSDRQRTFRNAHTLTNGTMVIEGTVGAEGTASPIGTRAISLSDGNGGNMVSSLYGVRSVFMANADTSFDRTLSLGGGNGSEMTGAGLIYYGTGNINVYNGFKIGGLNTSGVVTFSGNITSSNVTIGTNKKITIGHNVALLSETGGTVDFKGIISDSGTVEAQTRIMINQFRHHAQLDTNGDGVLNVEANRAVGTASQGTIRLYAANTYEGGTEVMGGTLLVHNTTGSATGSGMILVNTGTRFGGSGQVSPGAHQLKLAQGATLSPGDSTLQGGLGTLKVQGNVQFNASGGTQLDFQIAALNGLNGSVSDNWNGSALNWTAILAGTMNAGANDFVDIDGWLEVNTSGETVVNLSALGEGNFEAGMAWNLWDAKTMSSTEASRYTFNFQGLDAHLASLGLTFDTTHFSDHGILAVSAVVPEPSRALLGMVALAGLAFHRRRGIFSGKAR